MLVFDRKEPIQKVLNTCREELRIREKVKGMALLEGDEVRTCVRRKRIYMCKIF